MPAIQWIPVWTERLGWVLVHFLWQGALIALLAWLVLASIRNASAQVRYLILCGSLLACAVAPCVTWEILAGSARGIAGPETVLQSVGTSVPAATAQAPMVQAVVEKPVFTASAEIPRRVWSLESVRGAIQGVIPYLVMVWGIGVMILSLRLLNGWMQLRALRASGRPVKEREWVRRLESVAKRMGVERAVQLLESARVEVPTVIGWIKPILLLPVAFLAGVPPEQVEAILAHELAHIRRHDYIVNLVQILIETVLFYHPAVWWISRAIRQERENCCDDLALGVVGDKLTYAAALAAIEESRSLPGAITMAASGGSLLARIRRLVRPAEHGSRMGGVLAASGVILVAVLAASILRAKAGTEQTAGDPFGDLDFSKADQNDDGSYAMAYRSEVLDDQLEKAAVYLKHGMTVNPEVLGGGRDDILANAAWFTKDPAMIRLLLAHGAKCQGNGRSGNSTVNVAIDTGNKEIADLLIAAGGAYDPVRYDAAFGQVDDLKARDSKQPLAPVEVKKALGCAVDAGQVQSFDWLWSKLHPGGVISDSKELDGYYAKAAGAGQLPLMLHLEKMGVNLMSAGPRALQSAAGTNHLPEAEHLFDLGVTLPKDGGELRDLAGDGDVEMMKLLLDHGVDINEKDDQGMTALCWAGYSRQNAACLLLVDRGIDVNLTDNDGRNAAFYAAGGNLPDTLAALIKKGVRLDLRDKNGGSVLDYMNGFSVPRAGRVGFPGRVLWPAELEKYNADVQRTVSILAAAHVDLSASGPDNNALDRALSDQGNYALARALLANGAPIAGDGHQALLDLCDGGWDQAIPLDLLTDLLQRGANPNVPANASPVPGAQNFPPPEPVVYALFNKAVRSYNDTAIQSSARAALPILLAHGATFAGNPTGETKEALEAAALGDLPRLQSAISKGGSIDAADAQGYTPLIVAMAMGDEDCVQWLLSGGANVTKMTNMGASPLLFAAMRQETDRVAAFLAKGANPNWIIADGGSPLIGWAVNGNNLPMFRILVAAGAKGSRDDLLPAIRAGNVEMVRTMLDQGVASDDPKPFENRGTVYWAVNYGNADILKLLLDHGANPELKTDYNETPLSDAQKSHKDLVPILEAAIARRHQAPPQAATMPAQSSALLSSTLQQEIATAVKNSDAVSLQKLLTDGVDPNKIKYDGEPLLFLSRSPEVAEILIKHGADPNASDGAGDHALPYLCIHGGNEKVAIVRVLLTHGANPNIREGEFNQTPLIEAADPAIVDVLAEYGGDLYAKDAWGGQSVLVMTAWHNLNAFEAVMRHGVPFDPKTDGATMLVRAEWDNNLTTATWLLNHGVDPNTRGFWALDAQGKPVTNLPLEDAAMLGHEDMIKLLLDHGANADESMIYALRNAKVKAVKLLWNHGVRSISGLCYAVSQGMPVTGLQSLLDAGSPVDPPQDTVITPLAVAASLGNMETVEFLVEHGADVNKGGTMTPGNPDYVDTALAMAAGAGQDEIVDYLLQHGAHASYSALSEAVYNSIPYFTKRTQDHFERGVKLLIDAGALKQLTQIQAGKILEAAIGTRLGPPDTTVLKMLLDQGLSPELPAPQIEEKPNSVIGSIRDYYNKYRSSGDPYEEGSASQIKPALDLLEKADAAGTNTAAPSGA